MYPGTNRSSGIRFLDIVREECTKPASFVPDAFVWLSSFTLLKKPNNLR